MMAMMTRTMKRSMKSTWSMMTAMMTSSSMSPPAVMMTATATKSSSSTSTTTSSSDTTPSTSVLVRFTSHRFNFLLLLHLHIRSLHIGIPFVTKVTRWRRTVWMTMWWMIKIAIHWWTVRRKSMTMWWWRVLIKVTTKMTESIGITRILRPHSAGNGIALRRSLYLIHGDQPFLVNIADPQFQRLPIPSLCHCKCILQILLSRNSRITSILIFKRHRKLVSILKPKRFAHINHQVIIQRITTFLILRLVFP